MKFICNKYPYYKIYNDGNYINFKKGKYETENKKEIELLKNLNDVDILEEIKEKKLKTIKTEYK